MTSTTLTLDDLVDPEYRAVFRELPERVLDESDIAGAVAAIRLAGAARRAQLPTPVHHPTSRSTITRRRSAPTNRRSWCESTGPQQPRPQHWRFSTFTEAG